jgi:hypothetical protein
VKIYPRISGKDGSESGSGCINQMQVLCEKRVFVTVHSDKNFELHEHWIELNWIELSDCLRSYYFKYF